MLEHDDGDGDNCDDDDGDGDGDDGDNGDGDEDNTWKEFVFLFYENIDNFVKLLC